MSKGTGTMPEKYPFNRKGPEMLKPPRYCCCGHKLQGNERAFYSFGRWSCPKCLQADRETVPDYDGPQVVE